MVAVAGLPLLGVKMTLKSAFAKPLTTLLVSELSVPLSVTMPAFSVALMRLSLAMAFRLTAESGTVKFKAVAPLRPA